MWFILTSVVAVLVIFLVFKNGKKLNVPPGPVGLPLIGNLLSIDPVNPHLSLAEITKKYDGICGIWMGSIYTVLLSDPKLVRQAFAKDSLTGRAPLYLTHGIMQGYGLVCSEGDHWKEQRKFVISSLKSLGMVKHGYKRHKLEIRITNSIKKLITKLQKYDSRGVDPLEDLHHCLGNLINDLVFGKVYEEYDETWKWLRHLQEDGVKHIGIAGPLNFFPFLRHLPRYKKLMNSLIGGKLKTHQVYKEIVEANEHRKIYTQIMESGEMGELKNSDFSSEDDTISSTTDSFLSSFAEEMKNRVLNNEKMGSFTDQQFYHALADLYGAGVDTTLTTIRWILLLLAAHPEEQKRVYQEISRNVEDREIVLEDRETLLYLEACICEAQRIRSVVPLGIPHGTTQDTKIGDFDVPKGTMVVPFQWAIHMNEEFFEDPEEFRPNRFISEDGLKRPEAFIPFLTGKRMCVGDELARWILFLYVGRILQKFQVCQPEETKLDLSGECGITLVPKPNKLVFLER